ncbi:hypothetical protein BOTBODRAFT_72980, partial [Botryobasidium botryosum FD-172 SS1]
CAFCGGPSHVLADCHRFKAAQTKAKEEREEVARNQQKKKRGGGAKAAQEASQDTNRATEFAGNASITPPSSPARVFNPSADWNTDTGATSHMTPHRHWFTTYTPTRTPIRLADNSIVYAEGIGSVQFQLVF